MDKQPQISAEEARFRGMLPAKPQTTDPTINKWLPQILEEGSSAEERYIDGSLVGIYIKFAEPIYPEVTQ
jgi:hypothetical protein